MYSPIRYLILSDRIESGFATAAEKEEFLRLKEELDQLKQQEEITYQEVKTSHLQ